MAAAAVFEMLEPPGYSVPACGSLNGCARGDVAEHADGFIERRAVPTVEHGLDERGCNLWRHGGVRFRLFPPLGPPPHRPCALLNRGHRHPDPTPEPPLIK